jgi:uncharacterized protein (DUF924 family)
MGDISYNFILNFWFSDAVKGHWFAKDDAFDLKVKGKFLALHKKAVAKADLLWDSNPESVLAEVILLDQFSRNMFRGDERAFANDDRALALAEDAIGEGFDLRLDKIRCRFLYMPFMHSENLGMQERSVALFESLGDILSLNYAVEHKKVIEKFGRFPGRNEVLGRKSSKEEKAYLKKVGDW